MCCLHMRELFEKDVKRRERFILSACGLHLDYSENLGGRRDAHDFMTIPAKRKSFIRCQLSSLLNRLTDRRLANLCETGLRYCVCLVVLHR